MKLKGKTAAVIGGGGGIGRELVIALVREGVKVMVGDIDEDAAKETARLANSGGSSAVAASCDIADDASVTAFADASFAALDRIDLLFNHAGASLGGLLEEVTSEDWNWLLNINITGLGRSISSFLPRMTAQGGGWIVNTSSGLGLFHDMPFGAPYIATKAAIIAYSRSLSTYALNRDIGVSVFCPDITNTAFLGAGRLKGIPREAIAGATPHDRMQTAGQAAEILINGLKAEKFLISAVPDTSEKLLAMAKADLAPTSDNFDPDGLPKTIVSKASMRVPLEAKEEILELFSAFAEKSRLHHGCRCYDIAVSSVDPGQLMIFEVWESQAALDAHGAAPGSMGLISAVIKLGATDFVVTEV